MTRKNSPAPGSAGSSKSAVEKVEDYMRTESRLSQIDKPEAEDGETKGAYCWRLIRHCVKNAVNLVSKANLKDIVTGHGVHHCRRLNHAECLQHVIYNKNTRVSCSPNKNKIPLKRKRRE